MTPRPLTFSEYVDWVLARLYELDRDEIAADAPLVDVRQLSEDLRAPVKSDWPQDAVKVLKSRDLVFGVIAGAGTAEAMITGEGRLFVEQAARQDRGIIREYQEQPQTIVNVHGSGHQVSVANTGSTTQTRSESTDGIAEVIALLETIAETLRDDAALSDDERVEHLADVEAARGQLTKSRPNVAAAVALLAALGDVASVGSLAISAAQILS